jgi:FkbM family methyltransferase
VYDVGANAGYYSLLSASRAARVFAFEPVPAIADFLERHLRMNGAANCRVVRQAMGDAPGEAKFALTQGKNSGMGHLSDDGSISVRITTLDDFCGDHPPPPLIKMDIEGAETLALKGAKRVWLENRPVIFLATHGNSRQKYISLLQSNNYKIAMLANDEVLATPQ